MNNNQPLLVIWWPKALDQTRAEEEGRTIRVRYEVLARSGDKLHGGDEALNKLPKDLPCLVLVNPTELGLFAVVPPKLSGAKLKEALPFLVEPYLLNEPEENHVSLWSNLPSHANGARLAAVLGKIRARSIVSTCTQHGLKLAGLSCETLRERTGSEGAAWLSGQDFILVDGIDTPLLTPTGQPAVLKVMLQRRLQQLGAPMIQLSSNDHAWLHSQVDGALGENKIQATDRAPVEPLPRLLTKSLLGADELRKMGMRPMANQGGLSKLLTPALVLAAVAVLGLNALAFKAERANAAIETQITESYTQALPNIPMVADPLLLIEREKRNLNAGLDTSNAQGLSALLHEVGQAMDQAPFNSMVDFAWADNTLSVRFNANVTEEQQGAALQKLKARRLDAKWLTGAKSNLPVLQVKKGATR
ncbi:type II secretion system protein GspL [Limnobacter sp.]|uniref:type II secretion system protein GspL n=1 Tax=Limnobacter sp. TaxID=2003368 RepID=UPI002FE1D583